MINIFWIFNIYCNIYHGRKLVRLSNWNNSLKFVMVGCVRGSTRALKCTILLHVLYKSWMLSSTQNGDGPSDALSGRPKQLARYFNKIAKIKTVNS